MAELVDIATQNGLSVLCVIFMIYYINTTMKDNNFILHEIQKTLVSMQEVLSDLKDRVDKIETKAKKVNKKEGE